MARILAISSQTVFGPVGNSAIVPALQEHGHEVFALPTTLLSNHPGLGKPVGRATDAQLMRDMLSRLDDMGVLETCDAVSTGYFANSEQVAVAAEAITALKGKKPGAVIQVDPVLGDNTALYVPEPVATAIRDMLIPLASITTPNRFELGWLTGTNPHSDSEIATSARMLAVPESIVTSAHVSSQVITTLLISDGGITRHSMPNVPGTPNGTGDFLSGQYLAHRMTMDAPQAFAAAMARVKFAVGQSAGRKTLHLARP